jgi:ribose/xylose/arabinose/galactoside ABC-type transport system permease subunit
VTSTERTSERFIDQRRRGQSLVARPESASLAFLVVITIVLAVFLPNFSTPGNLSSILAQVSVVGIVAVALNQVILAGEIDISSGSLLALCAIIAGTVAESTGGLVLPLLAAIGVGLLVGLFNGVLSTFGRIPSIIVTLATLSIIRGGILALFGGLALNAPRETRWLGLGQILFVPVPIVVFVVVIIVFALVNRHTDWGRNIMAIGDNERAARLIGIPVNVTKLITFVIAGAAVGLAALVYVGQVGQIQATAATGFELQAIAAVVVGGTSISGGRGSTYAPVIGAVLIGVITNAMSIAGVPGVLNDLVLGILILLAISTDIIRRRITGAPA